jgi:FAD/FMN-containing dehydrogenase
MNERPNPVETDRPTVAEGPSEYLRSVVQRASQNEDLFWGLRGSGGNLAVVTSLEYRLHEVGPVLGGAVCYPTDKVKDLVHLCVLGT